MSASPAIEAAFRAWCLAELASHYAQPCPDDVMNYLVNEHCTHGESLAAQPAGNLEDLLLKLYPLLLANFEPQTARGDHPLVLSLYGGGNGDDKLIQSVMADLVRLVPAIAEATAIEKPGRRRAA
jgi:hypothetical protein